LGYGSARLGGRFGRSACWPAKSMAKSTARPAPPYSVNSKSLIAYDPLRAVARERNALVLPRPIQRRVQLARNSAVPKFRNHIESFYISGALSFESGDVLAN
jgi:hypothetical protein